MDIKIERTEQWEYTASGHGLSATGSSEQGAELNYLRKIFNQLSEDEIKRSVKRNIHISKMRARI